MEQLKGRHTGGNDRSLESLRAMSGQLETLVPHLQTAKEEAEIVHKSMGDIVGTLGEMQEPLGKLYTRLRNIKSSTARWENSCRI